MEQRQAAMDQAAAGLLPLVRKVLRCVGDKINHPGFARAHALDSVGRLLCATEPEKFRKMLFDDDAPTRPHIKLWKREMDHVSFEDAKFLRSEDRHACVAIRQSDSMVKLYHTRSDTLSTIEITLEDASIVIKQQFNPLTIMMTFTSTQNARVKKSAMLDRENMDDLAALFHPPSLQQMPLLNTPRTLARSQAGAPGRVAYMPEWLTEHLASVAQDSYRLHTLLTATGDHGTSRAVVADHAYVCDSSLGEKPQRMLRLVLHPTSAQCVCCVYKHLTDKPPRRVCFDIRCCGTEPIVCGGALQCPHHWETTYTSSLFPGVCCQDMTVRLVCDHGSGGYINKKIQFPVEDNNRGLLHDLFSCAILVAKETQDTHKVQQMRDAMDRRYAAFERDLEACPKLDGEAARKLRGKRLEKFDAPAANSHIRKKYGHLFG